MIQIRNGPLRELLGIFLLVVGLFGLLVPIVPGWLFVLPGLALLGFNPLKRYFRKVKQRKALNHDKKNS